MNCDNVITVIMSVRFLGLLVSFISFLITTSCIHSGRNVSNLESFSSLGTPPTMSYVHPCPIVCSCSYSQNISTRGGTHHNHERDRAPTYRASRLSPTWLQLLKLEEPHAQNIWRDLFDSCGGTSPQRNLSNESSRRRFRESKRI